MNKTRRVQVIQMPTKFIKGPWKVVFHFHAVTSPAQRQGVFGYLSCREKPLAKVTKKNLLTAGLNAAKPIFHASWLDICVAPRRFSQSVWVTTIVLLQLSVVRLCRVRVLVGWLLAPFLAGKSEICMVHFSFVVLSIADVACGWEEARCYGYVLKKGGRERERDRETEREKDRGGRREERKGPGEEREREREREKVEEENVGWESRERAIESFKDMSHWHFGMQGGTYHWFEPSFSTCCPFYIRFFCSWFLFMNIGEILRNSK